MNTASTMDPTLLCDRLESAARKHVGDNVRVQHLQQLVGGHAGFTYAFELLLPGELQRVRAVLKLGPPGVRRTGVADVFRQAKLLSSLHESGLPVPNIVWADEGEEGLGAPYIVMEWVEGQQHFPLMDVDAKAGASPPLGVWASAVSLLTELERFPAPTVLTEWRAPVELAAELAGWEATLRKSPQAAWIDAGLRARDALEQTMPAVEPSVLVHGDFQPSNLLVNAGAITALIDWDLGHLGARGIDLGWLMMFADPEYWGSNWRTWSPLGPEELVAEYARVSGRAPRHSRWFHAFAGYRFGAIVCLNVRLHRSGRRTDPIWERFAADVPRLFARAESLARALPA